jgi:hypothetical protein
VAGAGVAAASVVSYIVTEGKIDAAAIPHSTDEIPDGIITAEEDGE